MPAQSSTHPWARAAAIAAIGVAACRFDAIDGEPGGPGTDAAAPCSWSFAPTVVAPCSLPPPTPISFAASIPQYLINTSPGNVTLTGPSGLVLLPHVEASTVVVVYADRIEIPEGVEVRATGSRPLAFVADTIEIAGRLTASSTVLHRGAGANPIDCAPAAQGQADTAGDDGGGGGGNGAAGGRGGPGNGRAAGPASGGAGGAARPLPARLAGGCPGASAAKAPGNTAGLGGDGGGAIALIARTSVVLRSTARVDAGGAGGGGGSSQGGGGGGGAGGTIRIETEQLTIAASAVLAANGGQGGGGSNNGTAMRGRDAEVSADAAISTNREGGGSSGGAGGASLAPAGQSVAESTNDGGGGGGGGVGYIVITTVSTATIDVAAVRSPPVTPVQPAR
jgi:hypothetical protein